MIWYTVTQAADRLGVQPRTIRIWIKTGMPVIRHDVVPGTLFIAEDVLLATYQAKRARGGYVERPG